MNILVADKIRKQFSGHLALDDVSIEVPESSIYGLLGPNGAGKTTLLRIINQITAPDTGNLFYQGQKLNSRHVSKIGYLPEERGLYRKMRVGEQLTYLSRLKGLDKTAATGKLKWWFEKFDITEWWNKKVEELSKGMQQKIQFILTVLHEPDLLIFDEPFSGFDPINANLLKEEILKLKNNGTTIIFSTHDMNSVEELCDHITLINKAQVILNGKVSALKNKFANNTYLVKYLANPENMLQDLPAGFEVLSSKKTDYSAIESTISLNPDKNLNHLLSVILPKVQIVSVNELIPSMEEVFIKAVKEHVEI